MVFAAFIDYGYYQQPLSNVNTNYSVNLIDKIIKKALDNRYTLSYSALTMTDTNTTTAQIKKGDLVYLFASWDDKGTFAYGEWLVDSAGRCQIHLRSTDGDMRKRRVYPNTEGIYQQLRLVSKTPDPDMVAVELAQVFLLAEIARYENLLTRNTSESAGYLNTLRERLMILKAATPTAIRKQF